MTEMAPKGSGANAVVAALTGEEPLPLMMGNVDIEALNRAWSSRSALAGTRATEYVEYERLAEGGVWKVGRIGLGSSQLIHDGLHVSASKLIIQENELTLLKEIGFYGRRVKEIRQILPGIRVGFKVPYEAVCLKYQVQDFSRVRLHWSGRAEYDAVGEDSRWAVLRRHYDGQKNMILHQVTPPVSILLREVTCRFGGKDKSVDIHFSVAGQLLDVPQQEAPAPFFSEDYVGLIVFLAPLFPIVYQGLPPLDSAWLVGTFAPPLSLIMNFGSLQPPWYFATYIPVGQLDVQADAVEAGPLPTINPRLRLVGPGDDKQELVLEPAGVNASWEMLGSAVGQLRSEGGKWFYHPPARPNPSATLVTENKTNRPAALQSTLPVLVSVDAIRATAGAGQAFADFVILHAPETHYLKVSMNEYLGKIQLKLYYTSFFEGEVEVSAANTRWKVLSGSGSVSQQGIFSDGTPDGKFTVLLAEDTDNQNGWFYYWAMIVIPYPLFNAAEVVKHLNDESM